MDQSVRESVRGRAGSCCEYCRVAQQFDPRPFQIDHIIAQQHGGSGALTNLALACYSCNKHKGPNIAGLDHLTRQTVRLFNPRTDDWHAHFRWVGPRLAGLTSIGRVTIDVLQLNRTHRVAFRLALLDEGVFPPQ